MSIYIGYGAFSIGIGRGDFIYISGWQSYIFGVWESRENKRTENNILLPTSVSVVKKLYLPAYSRQVEFSLVPFPKDPPRGAED